MRFKYLAAVLSLLPAAGAAQTYQCDMTTFGPGGFISNIYFIGIDRDVEAAAVFDLYTNEVYKAPLPVDTEKRSEALWPLKWTVKDFYVSNAGETDIRYRARLNLANNTLTVNGTVAGGDNNISGQGRCALAN